MNNKYDVFISYRRDGGFEMALHLSHVLRERGYHVFFDIEELRSGPFNMKLYDVIAGCKDFVVILSPGSLERCQNEDDWFRLEIACALKHNVNIIPFATRNFSFGDATKLPDEVAELQYLHGVTASHHYADAAIKKLTTFMRSRPSLRFLQRLRMLVVLFVSCLFVGAFALLIIERDDSPTNRVQELYVMHDEALLLADRQRSPLFSTNKQLVNDWFEGTLAELLLQRNKMLQTSDSLPIVPDVIEARIGMLKSSLDFDSLYVCPFEKSGDFAKSAKWRPESTAKEGSLHLVNMVVSREGFSDRRLRFLLEKSWTNCVIRDVIEMAQDRQQSVFRIWLEESLQEMEKINFMGDSGAIKGKSGTDYEINASRVVSPALRWF